MNEEYVVGLIRVSIAEYLKELKSGLGRACVSDMSAEYLSELIKAIHDAEESLRAPDMEIVKDIVKELRK